MVESSSDSQIQAKILTHLATSAIIEDTLQYAQDIGTNHTELDKALKSLTADEYVNLQVIERKLVELTEEGASYVEKGTPEFQFANALELNKPRSKEEMDKLLGKELGKIGFSKAMQRKWVQLDPNDKNSVIRLVENLDDTEREQLRKYVELPDLEQHDKKVVD